MTCNPFICTILFGLSELSKITLFKDLVGKIIEAKVAENGYFFALFPDSIIFWIKHLNKINLDDSYGPNKIVQINYFYVLYRHINI